MRISKAKSEHFVISQYCEIYEVQVFIFFFLKIIALFTYLWLHWVFIAALGLPLVVGSRGYSSCSAPASHCGGSSCCRASQALEHGLSSCGTRGLRCLEACGIFPDQGLNPCLVHCQAHS